MLVQNSYSSGPCTDHRRVPFSENYREFNEPLRGLWSVCWVEANSLPKEQIKVMFTLEQAMKDQRGSRDVALLFP